MIASNSADLKGPFSLNQQCPTSTNIMNVLRLAVGFSNVWKKTCHFSHFPNTLRQTAVILLLRLSMQVTKKGFLRLPKRSSDLQIQINITKQDQKTAVTVCWGSVKISVFFPDIRNPTANSRTFGVCWTLLQQ